MKHEFTQQQKTILFQGRGFPDLLACEGDPTLLNDPHVPKITVIGSRDASADALDTVNNIVSVTAAAGVRPLLISGLAYGVDTRLHRAALEAGLPTVAVVATGLETVYPYANRELAKEITRTPGCAVVTQFPEGTAALALNFLERTKTMVAMSDAVVVVQSKERGSSMMAARYACDLGIPVFAVPGRLSDIRHAGCNSLIRQNVATLFDYSDIVTICKLKA